MVKDHMLSGTALPSSSPSNAAHPAIRDCLTIDDFCRVNRLSTTHFFTLKKAGKGPRELQGVGRRVIITPQANEDWREAREKEARLAADEEPTGADLAALLVIAAT